MLKMSLNLKIILKDKRYNEYNASCWSKIAKLHLTGVISRNTFCKNKEMMNLREGGQNMGRVGGKKGRCGNAVSFHRKCSKS